jgi:hypothetical protein
MPKSFDFRDVDDLRSVCYAIHAFGLGFIQIKLTPECRIHLYIHEVRQTTEPEDVHDHRYGFTSTILRGGLTNDVFHVTPDVRGEFSLSEVTCKPGSAEADRKLFDCSLTHVGSFMIGAGNLYTLAADTFHRVSAQDGTITMLHREQPTKEFARVAKRKEQGMVCPFSANVFSEDELWEIYEQSVSRV